MSSKVSWVGALSTLLLAGTAHAQPAPGWYPAQYPAHVSIQAAPNTELEVVPAGAPAGSTAVARCAEYCDFWTLPGKYTLYALDHSTGQRRDLSLRIKQSSRFVYEAGDDDARTTGLVLGIGGSVATVTGVLLMMPALMSSMCHDTNCTSNAERDAATAGLVVLVAGLITTPIGWTMFAHNRARLKRFDEGAQRATETPNLRLGVVGVGLGGLGLGGVATF